MKYYEINSVLFFMKFDHKFIERTLCLDKKGRCVLSFETEDDRISRLILNDEIQVKKGRNKKNA